MPNYRTVCFCERDSCAAATLVEWMEAKALDCAPIWDSLESIGSQVPSGTMDVVCAGFPCQPFSVAGQQLGADDPRNLWPHVIDAICMVRPRLVFMENVPDVVTELGLRIASELTEAGYDSLWDIFSSTETGNSHDRQRWYALAYAQGIKGSEHKRKPKTMENGCSALTQKTAGKNTGARESRAITPEMGGSGMDDPIYPPSKNEIDRWIRITRRNPKLIPASKRGVYRMADGAPSRSDRIRMLGNSVDIMVAAYAFRTLAAAAGIEKIGYKNRSTLSPSGSH